MSRTVYLFGATGYTGALTAEALVERGIRPVLVGRDRERLERRSDAHDGLQWILADTSSPERLIDALQPGDTLLTTVGPFVRHGDTAIETAIQRRAHYIDSTGEPNFVHRLLNVYRQRIDEAQIAVLPAMAYDYALGHAVAALLLEDEGGATIRRIDIGYFTTGPGKTRLSRGTKQSLVEAWLEPSHFFRQGKLQLAQSATRLRTFDVAGKARSAISISGSEPFFLPRRYQGLREINVYLGWFGKLSYALHKQSQLLGSAGRLPFLKPTLRRVLDRIEPFVFTTERRGPSPQERSHSSSLVVAEAFDERDQLVGKTAMSGVNPYDFSAKMLAWVAEKVSGDEFRKTGVLGPIDAFGPNDLVAGCRQAGMGPTPSRVSG